MKVKSCNTFLHMQEVCTRIFSYLITKCIAHGLRKENIRLKLTTLHYLHLLLIVVTSICDFYHHGYHFSLVIVHTALKYLQRT